MKSKKTYRNRPLFYAFIVALGTVGCTNQLISSESSDANYQDLSASPSVNVRVEEMPGGGKALIQDNGWQIPALALEKKDESKIKAKTKEGLEVSVGFAKYTPEFGSMLVEADTAASIGLGDLNIQDIKEYKVKDRTFAYSFQVNQVEINKNDNTIKSSRGFVMDYLLYDENGDGRFETLALSETVWNRTAPSARAELGSKARL